MKSMLSYRMRHSTAFWKHVFSVPSLGNEPKRKIFRLNPLKLSKKTKYVLSIAIIVIMLVSVFAFLPKANQTKATVPISTDNSTAPPTAEPQNTKPPAPSDPFSQISSFFNGLGTSITQTVAPKAPGTIESNPSHE